MSSGRAMGSRRWAAAGPVGLVVALLLLVGGCAGGPGEGPIGAGGGAGDTRSGLPAGPSSLSSPAPSPTAARSSTAARSGPAAAAVPAVPQYRATLPPVATELPAPARFSASSIDVDLPVVSTGVAADGRMQLPETNREVAWYPFSSRPGDPAGTTVLAAHVDTRTEGLGPFAQLRRLDRGDRLEVTDARGRPHRYAVVSVDDVKKSELSLDRLFRRDGEPELKVLTCGGPYRRDTGYRDNIVVTATPS